MQSNQGSAPDQPRHWHGNPGNRHEQQNVWVIGGTPQPYVPSRDPWSPSYNPPTSTTPTKSSAIASTTTSSGPTSATTAVENATMATTTPNTAPTTTTRRVSSLPSNSYDTDSDSATSGTSSVYSPNANERRRSSAASAGGSPSLFSTLSNQKRSSADPAMAARRASWTEQGQKGNFLARWWNGYTRGQ